jgi:hypothetical protein
MPPCGLKALILFVCAPTLRLVKMPLPDGSLHRAALYNCAAEAVV